MLILILLIIIIIAVIIVVISIKPKGQQNENHIQIDVPVLQNGKITSHGKVIVSQPGIYPNSSISTNGGQNLRKCVLNNDKIRQNVFPPGMLIPCYNYIDNRTKKEEIVTYKDGTKVVVCDFNGDVDVSECEQFQQLIGSSKYKQQSLNGLVLKQEGSQKLPQSSYNVIGVSDNVQPNPMQQYVGINVLHTGMNVVYHMVLQ